MTLQEFKATLALVYRAALEHYRGDKARAEACVNAYCRGMGEADRRLAEVVEESRRQAMRDGDGILSA